MDPPKFLVLGAAGYIGGTVLTDLLKQYTASSITVLVRKPEQEQLFTTLGVNVVSGDVADAAKLKSLASEHDVVLNFAVAFGGDETSIQALVDGLEERARETQSKPVLLHTGGSGTVMYGSGGEAGADVWTDEQYDRWSSLPDTAFFYGGYKIVAAAALRGTISAYIVLSPTVYGRGTGPGNKLSLQLPAYTRYAKQHGQAAYIGKGENIWGNLEVHVEDLSQLTVAVAEFALRNPDKTTASASSKGWENLIYSGVDTHTWGPITKVLGDLLFARGETSKPSAIEIAEGEGILYMFGGNSFLAPSKKSKALGFRPKQKDLVSSMRDALPA
ncbi:hypothetical protein CUC08_Gglean004628 [Alternaria sp. MG1]|uniref:uncharacterized protein n=1 Tax=Alternaria postmessia TaxID=1187938 RepID=UPI000ECF3E4D|nr:uncharacterized protein J4E82_009990 [Alternaria postmessia]KAI5371353.1 hypothetical protein J4E82_009990 [Alternaria postmessia]RII13327.1 hypothetical protein CUC08_Gglean004628 [Alternaria sp. MG1]